MLATKGRTASRQPRSGTKRWSQRATQTSYALDLDRDVFTWRDPKRIARALGHSAEKSARRKAGPFQ